jgi:PTS system nitrogen regulatory IIA component
MELTSSMMIGLKEVAQILAVSEKTIYRWIAKKEIPAYKIGESYRFNRVELLEWATARKIKVSYKIFDEPFESDNDISSLTESLNIGGIHYRIPGTDKESVLKSIVHIMHLPDDVDKEFLIGALIARENLGTTAIGDGIAIPHVRNPIIFHVKKPVLALCFLEQPIDFSALDGKMVDTVFTIITHTVRSHLHVLSRLSYALHQPVVRSVLKGTASRQEILAALAGFESTLSGKSAGK